LKINIYLVLIKINICW